MWLLVLTKEAKTVYGEVTAYNSCGCMVEVEITYDCECCGTGYGGFTVTPCDAHR